jgi:hypothetical protein
MKDRFTPKKENPPKDPADIIAAKQYPKITEGEDMEGKHRVSLNLPNVMYDTVKIKAKNKGLTLTAYLIGLINKEIDNV